MLCYYCRRYIFVQTTIIKGATYHITETYTFGKSPRKKKKPRYCNGWLHWHYFITCSCLRDYLCTRSKPTTREKPNFRHGVSPPDAVPRIKIVKVFFFLCSINIFFVKLFELKKCYIIFVLNVILLLFLI